MANPNDAVGTNGAFGGRTSVNAFNDVLAAFSGRGIIRGWGCSPSSGLTVTLGGNGTDRDVAIAEDASGNKTTINNISGAPVPVVVNSAPVSNSRIDSIVAYIEDFPSGSGITDNPDVVNLLVVSGAVASSPVAPNDSAIRSAITADGASGSTAYYVVLASVRIAAGTTDIDATMIAQGDGVILTSALEPGSIGTDEIANNAVTADKLDYSTLQGSAQLPTASTEIKISVFEIALPVHRVGNVVSCGGSTIVNSLAAGNRQSTGITLPAGYRPMSGSEGIVLGECVDGQFSGGQPVVLTVQRDGKVLLSSSVDITSTTRIDIAGTWITGDAWPS